LLSKCCFVDNNSEMRKDLDLGNVIKTMFDSDEINPFVKHR